MEAAFGDKKCQFFDETRRFLKCIPGGTDEKSNAISAKKGHFLAQSVASKQALRACLERVRHENQGVMVLAKPFLARLAGQKSHKR